MQSLTVKVSKGRQLKAYLKTGIQGQQGVKGDKGDTGEQGLQGIQGVVAAVFPLQYIPETQTVQIADGYFVSDVEFIIDGLWTVISTGLKGYVEIPFNCNITGWTHIFKHKRAFSASKGFVLLRLS